MKTVLININSMVDVITNSSSEIYTWANENAIETTTEMLKELMKALDVQGEVSDYFDIEMVIDPEWEKSMREIAAEEDDIDSEELEEHINSGGYLHEGLLCYDGCYAKGTRIQVISKNGTPIVLDKMFSKIFDTRDCERY